MHSYPFPYEENALPFELISDLVSHEGFKPPTSSLEGKRSIRWTNENFVLHGRIELPTHTPCKGMALNHWANEEFYRA